MYVSTYKPYVYLYHTIYVHTYIHACVFILEPQVFRPLKDASFELVFRTQLLSHVSRSTAKPWPINRPSIRPPARQLVAACRPLFGWVLRKQKFAYMHSTSTAHSAAATAAARQPLAPHLYALVSKEHNRCRYTVSHTSKTLVKHRRRRRRRKQQQPIKIVIHRAIGDRISHLNRNLNRKSQFNIYSTFAVHFWLSTDDAGIHWETSALGGQCSPIGWATRVAPLE